MVDLDRCNSSIHRCNGGPRCSPRHMVLPHRTGGDSSPAHQPCGPFGCVLDQGSKRDMWAGMMLVGICDVTLMFMFIMFLVRTMNDIICYKLTNTQMHISIHSWKKDGKGLVTFHFVHRITGFNLTFPTDARGQRSTKRKSHLLSFSCADLICTHGMPGTIQNPSWLEIGSESAALLIVLLEHHGFNFCCLRAFRLWSHCTLAQYIATTHDTTSDMYIFFCEVQFHVQCLCHLGISSQLANILPNPLYRGVDFVQVKGLEMHRRQSLCLVPWALKDTLKEYFGRCFSGDFVDFLEGFRYLGSMFGDNEGSWYVCFLIDF